LLDLSSLLALSKFAVIDRRLTEDAGRAGIAADAAIVAGLLDRAARGAGKRHEQEDRKKDRRSWLSVRHEKRSRARAVPTLHVGV
jgi:hypothetical protein